MEIAGRRRYRPEGKECFKFKKDDAEEMKEINRTEQHTIQVRSTLYGY